jgi:hypothetical protein
MKVMTWHISCRDERNWLLELCGELLLRFDYKDDAIREGRWRADACATHGRRAVIVHRRDGTIEHEFHFGFDTAGAGR